MHVQWEEICEAMDLPLLNKLEWFSEHFGFSQAKAPRLWNKLPSDHPHALEGWSSLGVLPRSIFAKHSPDYVPMSLGLSPCIRCECPEVKLGVRLAFA